MYLSFHGVEPRNSLSLPLVAGGTPLGDIYRGSCYKRRACGQNPAQQGRHAERMTHACPGYGADDASPSDPDLDH
jgi:hypothetical protein